MKKFIKLIATALVFVLSLSLFACSGTESVETLNGKTPEEVYATVIDTVKNATVLEQSTTQDITMEIDGQKATMKQSVLAKMDGNNQYGKTTSVLTAEGEEMPILNLEYWYVDGMYYYNDGLNKFKCPMDLDEFLEDLGMGGEDAIGDIPLDWFENISFELENDLYSLSFDIKGEEYEEIFGELGLEGTDLSNIAYNIFFDADGNIVDNKMKFSMNLDLMGVICEAEVVSVSDFSFTLSSPITAPADADTYTLVPALGGLI